MSDRLTPMEAAEVLELPKPEAAPKKKDSYGTAVPKKPKKNYEGFLVVLCVLAIVLGSLLAVVSLRGLRITRVDGKLVLSLGGGDADSQDPGVQYQPLSPDPDKAFPSVSPSTEDGPALNFSSGDPETPLSAQDLYEKTAPSVVCLTVRSFYGEVTGTGVILSQDGYILTSEDLYLRGGELTVLLHDGTACGGVLIGYDAVTGLALIKAEAEGLTPVEFGSADSLRVGDTVYSIGNPHGSAMPEVLSSGMISARQTAVVSGRSLELLQTTAVFEQDPNGCPIFSTAGQVVALTTTLSPDGNELTCAVTSEYVKQTVQRLLNTDLSRDACWAGFDVEQIPDNYLLYYGYPGRLWISSVSEGTAAGEILYEYDVITAVDGTQVTTVEAFQAALDAHQPGDTVTITLYRAGCWYSATLPLTGK